MTRRKAPKKALKRVWTEPQYDELLEARVDFAEQERALNGRFNSMEIVQTAKAEFPTEYYPKQLLSKALAQAMKERDSEREELDRDISVTASVGERESLDLESLKGALEKRFDDADIIAAIIDEATVFTPFTQVRVNFPRAKKEQSSKKKKQSRMRR